MTMAQPRQHRRSRRGGLVAAIELLTGLDQRKALGCIGAQRFQHFGGEHFAHAALERQPPVATARPGRLARSLGAEIEQPTIHGINALAKEKAASVAKVRIIGTELMPVIAQRQRLRQRAGQGVKPPEMFQPLSLVQIAQSQPLRPALVAMAQNCLREVGWVDRIKKAGPQLQMSFGGKELCHGGPTLPRSLSFVAQTGSAFPSLVVLPKSAYSGTNDAVFRSDFAPPLPGR